MVVYKIFKSRIMLYITWDTFMVDGMTENEPFQSIQLCCYTLKDVEYYPPLMINPLLRGDRCY